MTGPGSTGVKRKGKSRKGTLIRVLSEVGNMDGIEIFRTPGEEAAVKIALGLIERSTLRELDEVAKHVSAAEPFWSKQW